MNTPSEALQHEMTEMTVYIKPLDRKAKLAMLSADITNRNLIRTRVEMSYPRSSDSNLACQISLNRQIHMTESGSCSMRLVVTF